MSSSVELGPQSAAQNPIDPGPLPATTVEAIAAGGALFVAVGGMALFVAWVRRRDRRVHEAALLKHQESVGSIQVGAQAVHA